MFESLDDTMKKDHEAATSKSERLMLWAGVAIASILVFGGIYYGFQYLS